MERSPQQMLISVVNNNKWKTKNTAVYTTVQNVHSTANIICFQCEQIMT